MTFPELGSNSITDFACGSNPIILSAGSFFISSSAKAVGSIIACNESITDNNRVKINLFFFITDLQNNYYEVIFTSI